MEGTGSYPRYPCNPRLKGFGIGTQASEFYRAGLRRAFGKAGITRMDRMGTKKKLKG